MTLCEILIMFDWFLLFLETDARSLTGRAPSSEIIWITNARWSSMVRYHIGFHPYHGQAISVWRERFDIQSFLMCASELQKNGSRFFSANMALQQLCCAFECGEGMKIDFSVHNKLRQWRKQRRFENQYGGKECSLTMLTSTNVPNAGRYSSWLTMRKQFYRFLTTNINHTFSGTADAYELHLIFVQ